MRYALEKLREALVDYQDSIAAAVGAGAREVPRL